MKCVISRSDEGGGQGNQRSHRVKGGLRRRLHAD